MRRKKKWFLSAELAIMRLGIEILGQPVTTPTLVAHEGIRAVVLYSRLVT